MLPEEIENLPLQLEFQPIIQNESALTDNFSSYIVAAMGGSQLPTDAIRVWNPTLDIVPHRDYGLTPSAVRNPEKILVIASSYSGNTEETLDAWETAQKQNLTCAAVSSDGKLLAHAQQRNLAYIKLPVSNLAPRNAIGFMVLALLKLLGQEKAIFQIQKTLPNIKEEVLKTQSQGEQLAKKIVGRIPIIYCSTKNMGLAYNWKVRLNETAKIPLFTNAIPEMNHAEIAGYQRFDYAKQFYAIMLSDESDHPRIKLRFKLTSEMLKQQGTEVEILQLNGNNTWQKIFSNILLADWTGYYLAKNLPAVESISLINEIKKKMR